MFIIVCSPAPLDLRTRKALHNISSRFSSCQDGEHSGGPCRVHHHPKKKLPGAARLMDLILPPKKKVSFVALDLVGG